MKKSKNGQSILINILNEKCPKCDKGDVFKKKVGLLKMPKMHETCPECNYRFEREPGYFIGAMYISYALAVLLGLPSFLALHYSFSVLDLGQKIFLVILILIIFSSKNFKWSRLIYLRIFP